MKGKQDRDLQNMLRPTTHKTEVNNQRDKFGGGDTETPKKAKGSDYKKAKQQAIAQYWEYVEPTIRQVSEMMRQKRHEREANNYFDNTKHTKSIEEVSGEYKETMKETYNQFQKTLKQIEKQFRNE